jgi:hypothetical protein
MNQFLKVALVGGLIVTALLIWPGLAFPFVGGVAGGIAALILLALLLLSAVGLTVLAGGAALFGVFVALLVVAAVVLAVLSPVLVPALIVCGIVMLFAKLTRRPATPAAAVSA